MSTYTQQQIQGVLNNPNEFPPKMVADMISDGCFQMSELTTITLSQRSFVEKQLEMVQETKDYENCCSPNATYEQLDLFLAKYPLSKYRAKIEEKILPMREDRREYDNFLSKLNTLNNDFDNKFEAINRFRANNPSNRFMDQVASLESSILAQKTEYEEQQRRELAKQQQLQEEQMRLMRERQEDEEAWARVVSAIENPNYDTDAKKSCLMSYDTNPMYTLHKHEVPSRLNQIDREKVIMPTIMAVLNDKDSVVADFIRLCENYPTKKQILKELMLKDMRTNPSRYDREGMIWLLKGKDGKGPIFSVEELVASNIAPIEIWNHILKHPEDRFDKDPLEEDLMPETNFNSAEYTTDVYFFGVPGSGKTTVLAGLFNVDRCDNLRLKLPAHGDHIGINYASILHNYLSRHLFPQRTKTTFVLQQALPSDGAFDSNPFAENIDINPLSAKVGSDIGDKFIQIVDAVLIENKQNSASVEHKLSLIEMPGERTLEFAAADIRDPEKMDELLGKGTKQLFMNGNRKVFFFVLDPNPRKSYNVPLNGRMTQMTQNLALTTLVDFLRTVPGLMVKVDAIHVILTKSDMLSKPSSIDCITDEVINKGYEGLVEDLNELCNESRSNANAQCGHRVHLFTFSLGKVYPGHMIRYNKEDSAKVLKAIAANTYIVRTEPTKWESIVEWMNK